MKPSLVWVKVCACLNVYKLSQCEKLILSNSIKNSDQIFITDLAISDINARNSISEN